MSGEATKTLICCLWENKVVNGTFQLGFLLLGVWVILLVAGELLRSNILPLILVLEMLK